MAAGEVLTWIFFISFLIFVSIGLMNLLAAVFVDHVLDASREGKSTEAVADANSDEKKEAQKQLLILFQMLDKSKNGVLDDEELQQAVIEIATRPEYRRILRKIKMTPEAAKWCLCVLQSTNDLSVCYDEFMDVMDHYDDPAKVSDFFLLERRTTARQTLLIDELKVLQRKTMSITKHFGIQTNVKGGTEDDMGFYTRLKRTVGNVDMMDTMMHKSHVWIASKRKYANYDVEFQKKANYVSIALSKANTERDGKKTLKLVHDVVGLLDECLLLRHKCEQAVGQMVEMIDTEYTQNAKSKDKKKRQDAEVHHRLIRPWLKAHQDAEKDRADMTRDFQLAVWNIEASVRENGYNEEEPALLEPIVEVAGDMEDDSKDEMVEGADL